MRVAKLRIENFRGIRSGEFALSDRSVIVGANGCGKSTLVDALALVLGRPRMVRQLTEHDFIGANPQPADRLRLIATVTGFPSEGPDECADWFRPGRAVEKWVDTEGRVHATQAAGRTLAAEIAFAARFDHEDLTVEQKRYFHDDDRQEDAFDENVPVELVPAHLVNVVCSTVARLDQPIW